MYDCHPDGLRTPANTPRDGDLLPLAMLTSIKHIPITDVLSVRLTGTATLVLQCRRRVYTFRLPKALRAVATQLAAVLQPLVLSGYESLPSNTPSFTPSQTPSVTPHATPQSAVPGASPWLANTNDHVSVASSLAASAAASLPARCSLGMGDARVQRP